MTDDDIIAQIKRDILCGRTDTYLVLIVEDAETRSRRFFSHAYLDEMMTAMFDLSLTKTIDSVHPSGNGQSVNCYTIHLKDSKDGQTNITGKLLKFLEIVLNREWLVRLAEYPRRVKVASEFGFSAGDFLQHEKTPWEQMEEILNDEDA
jgi:hypothetical protein